MDEVQRLILEVKGRQDAEELRRALEAEENTLRALNEQLKATGSLNAAQAAQQKRTAESMVQHRAELKKTESGMRGYGSAAMQASYAFQDLTSMQGDWLRGLMAVQNNIPGILMALGMNQGLAGAISAVSVVAGLAAPHIAAFLESLNPRQVSALLGTLDETKKKIEDLENKPHKLSIDYAELDTAKRHLEEMSKALEAFQSARTSYEAEDLAGRATKAVRETTGGSEAIFKAVREGQTFNYANPADIDALAKAKQQLKGVKEDKFLDPVTRSIGVAKFESDIAKIQKRIEDANNEAAQKEVGEFLGGDLGAIARMRQRTLKEPGRFTPEFRKQVQALPYNEETLKAVREGTKAQERDRDDIARAQAQRREQITAENKAADDRRAFLRKQREHGEMLQKEGLVGESEMLQRQRAERNREIDRDRAQADARDKARAEMEKGLGDQFLDAAASRQAEISAIAGPKTRSREQARFNQQLNAAARNQLIQQGTAPAEAENLLNPEVSGGVGRAVRQHLQQRQAESGAMAQGGGTTDITGQLQATIAQQRAFIEGYQQQQAQMMGGLQQMGQMYGAGAAQQRMMMGNFRGVQGGLQSNDFSYFPGQY